VVMATTHIQSIHVCVPWGGWWPGARVRPVGVGSDRAGSGGGVGGDFRGEDPTGVDLPGLGGCAGASPSRCGRGGPNPETAHVVRWIFAQRFEGHSVARIARSTRRPSRAR
jgi:hypothetical protein